jgi:BlaI family penicillinase repressor
MPTVPRHTARQSALRHLMETFFEGSAEKMLSTLLGSDGSRLSEGELERLALLIENARKKGRK